jgi:predicted ester cyclase
VSDLGSAPGRRIDATHLAATVARQLGERRNQGFVRPQAERQFIAGALTAFPYLHFDVEQLAAENDLVFCRLTARGTHRAEFMRVSPSGRPVRFESVDIFRLLDAKIAEQWVVMDTFGLLQQIGAISSPGETQA